MRLKIVSVGEPGLRTSSQALSREEILSPRIHDLIEHMRETIRDAPGVGLAAPQVGESIQLVVIEDRVEYHKTLSGAELQERDRREIPFHVLINPVIEAVGESTTSFFEGCLSLPGYTALVSRARQVRVSALDHHGESSVIEASGWYARILQHEIDHLHGALYIDRMDPRTFSTLENYTRHGKNTKTSP
jgi:peptide deformylase